MAEKVKVRRDIACKDLTRASAWRVQMCLPIDEEQFSTVWQIVHQLRNITGNFLIVDFEYLLERMQYVQVARVREDRYWVEVNIKEPAAFMIRRDGEIYVETNPWTQYRRSVKTPEEAAAILEDILCRAQRPNLQQWQDITGSIFLEGWRREHPGEELYLVP